MQIISDHTTTLLAGISLNSTVAYNSNTNLGFIYMVRPFLNRVGVLYKMPHEHLLQAQSNGSGWCHDLFYNNQDGCVYEW